MELFKVFNSLRQITRLNLGTGFLYYLINVIKLYKNQSVKANFILTTPATLNNIKHANVNHSFNQLLMCYVFEKKTIGGLFEQYHKKNQSMCFH